MSYQVIARKWRPQKFSDMVGQEHLARTLKNAVISGRIAHAYLFVGPRGIGKTTTARIFAKAINCLHPVDGEPCCQCSSCKSIADESNVDVIEIDAATHTQVEKARELCEDVLHLPIASKYKIYIIDEVHMLSKNAWNALLKTIEEPPAHAKFIFATTEVNKVLPTVISRCQRFDLRRIKGADIAGRLRLICDTEGVKISDSALQIIARAADGGMRDAQSLLDQMISFFSSDNGEITEDQALSLFGLAASADMEQLIRAIAGNDRASALEMLHRFAVAGKNLEMLYGEIISWLRGILLCRIVSNPVELLEDSPEKIELYRSIAAAANPGAIQRLLEQLSSSGYLLREAINKQVFMESILLKAMRIAHAVQIEDLIARLNQLRNAGELDAVRSLVPIYEMPVGQIVVPKDTVFAPAVNRTAETAIVNAGDIKKKIESPVPVTAPVPEPVLNEPAAALEAEEEDTEQFAEIPPEPVVPTEEIPAAVPMAEEETSEPEQPETEIDLEADSYREPDQITAPEPGRKADTLWQELIIDIRDCLRKGFLATAMIDATPIALEGSRLLVAFDQDYEELQYETVDSEYPLLLSRLRAITGEPDLKLSFTMRRGLATPLQINQREDVEKLKQNAIGNPLVQSAIELFQGKLADAMSADSAEESL